MSIIYRNKFLPHINHTFSVLKSVWFKLFKEIITNFFENLKEHVGTRCEQIEGRQMSVPSYVNPLNAELNPICHLLALLGVHHILHVSRIRVKSLTFRLLTWRIW